MRCFSRALGVATVFLAVAAPLSAHAAPPRVVNVSAPGVNCVFNPTCTGVVTDSVGNFALPGDGGAGRLQSRTFAGADNAPAVGKTGYIYRLDMTPMTAPAGSARCLAALTLDFGPIAQLHYEGSAGPLDDVYVVTGGGIGSIGIASADQSGAAITFTFSSPVCPGQTSYFFGLASSGLPGPTTTPLIPSTSGAPLLVAGRSPTQR